MERARQFARNGDAVALALPPLADADAVRAGLAAIVASRVFRSSQRQRKFLSYVVEETLEGRGAQLKEFSIGLEVFGKDQSFDPRLDTIVRVEARKVRAKILEYYREEGKHDPLRIDFVKGSYAPVFRTAEDTLALPSTFPDAPAQGTKVDFPWRRLVGGLILLILLASAAYFFARNRTSSTPTTASIAVLPFVNLGDEKNEFFSDGLTDELIDSFGRIPGLHVVGRASVFQFKGKAIDLREIGRKLNVRTVLEGSVRESGGLLRITVELDDTSNGYRLWSHSYDGQLKDILVVQRQISASIANALGGTLRGSEAFLTNGSRFDQAASVNSSAYENYLKGRYFWYKSTAANLNIALQYFQRSIDEDPSYALPYVGLASCYGALPFHGVSTVLQMAPKIRALATKALELDSSLGEAHFELAQASAAEYDLTTAFAEFRKGLELSPGSALGHRWYGIFLGHVGQLEASLNEARQALELDPVSLYESTAVGTALYHLRRYDEAIDQFEKTLALEPNFGLAHLGLGQTYLQKGMFSKGLAEIILGRQLLEGDLMTTSKLGYAYALAGQTALAHETLDRFLEQSKLGPFRPAAIADVYVGLGDKDHAFLWLNKALDAGDFPPLKAEPMYDSLRSDPRFEKLLIRMKLQ